MINGNRPPPANDFELLLRLLPADCDWPMYIGKINLQGSSQSVHDLAKDQALFPHMPCNACGKDHPYFNMFPGKNLTTSTSTGL